MFVIKLLAIIFFKRCKRYIILAIPFFKRCKRYIILAIPFFKRYIYMPFTEQEKNNLVNDGKFTIEQVNYYDSTGISYDKIKEL